MRVHAGMAVVLAVMAGGCGGGGPAPAIPREMTDCVPASALMVAGARLDTLRASPFYSRLPGAARSFLEPMRDASVLLAAFDGSGILLVEQGHFRETPPGATQAGPDLVLSGSPALVDAAQAQRRGGRHTDSALVAQAEGAASGHALWIAARGRVDLPLTGDLANLTRLLRQADFATLGLRLDPSPGVDFTAQCTSPEAARHLEETLRAFLSLTAAGVARQAALAAMLRGAEVKSDATSVRATLTAPPEVLPQLFDFFGR